jgi:rieske iron-sulfur protein
MSDSAEPAREAAAPAAEDCACSRRRFLQTAIGTGVAISLGSARADDPPPSPESTALPKAGDHLVFAEGEKAGQEIKPADLKQGEQQTMAWPIDPNSKVVRSGSRLNEILVIRLDPAGFDDNTKQYAAEGIVAYSAICKHAQCPVTGWNKENQTLHCFCHATEYDPRKGAAVLSGPAQRPLPILPVKIVDGALVVAAPLRGKVGNPSV